MMDGTAVDTSTVLVLAAIALAEGLARVPAGAVVLRRFLHGPWYIERSTAEPGFRLVHWWSPWTDALVVPPRSGSEVALSRAELVSRLAATVIVRRAARLIGAATLIVLVVGVPAAVGFGGALGGLLALGGVFSGQVALSLLGWRGLALLGTSRRERVRTLAPNLNPFAAPALASRLLAAATTGATPAMVAQALLSPERWASWFRPRAYDAGVALKRDHELAQELDGADEAVVEVLAQRPVMAGDVLWCPRCAATYQAGSLACADCNITLLQAYQTAIPIAPLRAAPGLH